MIIMLSMHIMFSIIIIYGYRPGPMTVSTRHRLPRKPLPCQRAFPPAHWMRTASTKQLRPRTPLIPERTQLAQVHRSHPLQNLTRISQDGNARINWNRTPALSPKDGDKSGAPAGRSDAYSQTERAGRPPRLSSAKDGLRHSYFFAISDSSRDRCC